MEKAFNNIVISHANLLDKTKSSLPILAKQREHVSILKEENFRQYVCVEAKVFTSRYDQAAIKADFMR